MKTIHLVIAAFLFLSASLACRADLIWSSSFESSPSDDWNHIYEIGTIFYNAESARTGARGSEHYVPPDGTFVISRGRAQLDEYIFERQIRMWVNVDGFVIPEGVEKSILRDTGADTEVYLRNTGSQYQLVLQVISGDLREYSTPVPIDRTKWHEIDLYIKSESSDGAQDGIARWWLDGIERYNRTDCGLFPKTHSWVMGIAGPIAGDETEYGRVYVDDVTAYNTVTPPVLHTVDISSTEGGSVTNPGEGSFDYVESAVVDLVAVAESNNDFLGWTGSAVNAGKVSDPSSPSTTLRVDGDYTVQAMFALQQKTLAVSSTDGGTVTVPGEGSFNYDYGSPVPLDAVADENHHFVGWTGQAVDVGEVDDPDSPSTFVTLDDDYSVEAVFGIDLHTLTISSTDGGSVTAPGEGAFEYDHGSSAPITAEEEADYKFIGWTGTAVDAGKVTNPDNLSTEVTVDADYEVVANFMLIDANYDGLPDDWEQRIVDDDPNDEIVTIDDVHPEDDYDGDGNTNGTEQVAGTDPTDPGSFFAITGIKKSLLPLDVRIEWQSVDGKYYAVFYSDDDLGPGMTWTMAQDMIPADPSGTNEWHDDGGLTSPAPDDVNLFRRHYKLLVYPD